MPDPIDPILKYSVQNEISKMATQHYEESVNLLFRNLYQGGYLAGESPMLNRMERLATLKLEHDRNLDVATDVTVYPGDAVRAQAAIFEEFTLGKELFGE